jgi:predicted site-specific integrase-resolvase
MNTKLLTAEQVSEILGVNPHTLAVWRCTGRYNLPYIKAGRLVRYCENEVAAFINRSTKKSSSNEEYDFSEH